MSAEENKAVVRRLLEDGWNRGDFAAVDACVAPEGIIHSLGESAPCTPELEKGWITAWRTGFPDYRFDIIHLLADGELVIGLFPFTGTHTGPFPSPFDGQTLSPTGKPIHGWEMLIFRVVGGHIVERWNVWDRLAILDQLGAVPPGLPATP